jgi:CRP-like cAMP-binding protein
MPTKLTSSKPVNSLLTALPQEVYQRLLPDLQLITLPQHQILFLSGETYDYAYFPTNSMISSVSILENGATTELGIVGNEGMIGLPLILGTTFTNFAAIVQVGGNGYKIAAAPLQEELNRQEEFKSLLMRYTQARIIQLGQAAACNRHHKLEQRFARWLLTVRDSMNSNQFQLTQEFISQMLGVRRTGVTEIAGQFQKAGIIQYKRGFVEILDNQKLEATACECYQLIHQQFSRLLDIEIPS